MKKFILSLLLIAFLIGGLAAWKFFGPSIKASGDGYFYIPTGADYKKVTAELINKNLLRNTYWFDLTSRLLKYRVIKPGRYKLKSGMSVFSVVRMFRAGDQVPVNFVITKLRTKEDLARKAGNAFEFDSLQMINYLNNPDTLSEYGLDTNTVIAVFMPYTYTLNWNSNAKQFFDKCFSAYKRYWTRDKIMMADSLGLNRLEVVTLASIIEEETNHQPEKPNMASVYLNRIKKGMLLQADPTVKFAMRDFGLKRILHAHLETNSPYNTYMYKGLPPGPICTPSIESIEAVLHAPKTDYIYFVASSNFDGSHVFSTSYQEHLKLAKAYQQALDKRWDSLKQAKPQQP